MELQSYIASAFPEGLGYNDAAQLCLRLYCSVDGLPSEFHSQCTKDNLALIFTILSATGFIKDDAKMLAPLYGASFHSVNEKGHWIEVIASIFKKGDTVDMAVGNSLAKTLNNRLMSDAAKTRA